MGSNRGIKNLQTKERQNKNILTLKYTYFLWFKLCNKIIKLFEILTSFDF
jgi:amino acid permease